MPEIRSSFCDSVTHCRRLFQATVVLLLTLLVAPRAHAEGPKPEKACDIRTTDWNNFQFGKNKLKDGIKYLDKTQSFFAKVQADEIAYGDLTGDGKLEAYVPEGECSNEWCSNLIWVFEEGPSCQPRLLTKLFAGRGDGVIVGDQYVFVRQRNPNEEAHPVAVAYVAGKFAEVKPKLIPASLQPVGPWLSPATQRHAVTLTPSSTATDIYIVVELKTVDGFPVPTKVSVQWGKFKHEGTLQAASSIGLKVHRAKADVGPFEITSDGAVVFGPVEAKEAPLEFQNSGQQLKW